MSRGEIVYRTGQSTVAPRLWGIIARFPAFKRRARLKSRSAAGRSTSQSLLKKAGLFAFFALFVFFTSSAHFARCYPTEGGIIFRDIAKAAGIHFVHDNAATAEKYLIETMGSGCGWIDYDADGLLDLYLVNSAATRLYKPKKPLRGALYRNNGDGKFTDVTEKAGVGAEGLFGMGVAVGDYDNDGYPDLMVLGYDRSILYHNNRNGTFSDVTERAGGRSE